MIDERGLQERSLSVIAGPCRFRHERTLVIFLNVFSVGQEDAMFAARSTRVPRYDRAVFVPRLQRGKLSMSEKEENEG